MRSKPQSRVPTAPPLFRWAAWLCLPCSLIGCATPAPIARQVPPPPADLAEPCGAGPGYPPGEALLADLLEVMRQREGAAGRAHLENRAVLLPARPGGGQATARLGDPEQHVGERPARLLAGEPGEQHGRHLLGPGQQHRGAGVDHHDGTRIGRRHPCHQLVLTAGQSK